MFKYPQLQYFGEKGNFVTSVSEILLKQKARPLKIVKISQCDMIVAF